MPDTLRDGKGRGYLAEVTEENRIKTAAVSRSKEHDANLTYGESYNLVMTGQTPTGADDCFLYIKNTGTRNLVFEGFGIYCASNEKIYGKLGQIGTPAGGTDTIPANLNGGSGNAAPGVYQLGNNITGLSGGRTFMEYRIPANNATNIVNFESDIVLQPNQVFTVYASTGGILLEGHLNFWVDKEGA